MCNLDIIAGPLTEEQIWNRWFFNSLQDADFVAVLVIFGAGFVILVSVLVLFGVMFLRSRKPETARPAEEADGSIHIVPFLCSTLASMMFILAVFAALIVTVFYNHIALYTLSYNFAAIYTGVMAGLFGITLCFSPRAGKLFRIWNTVSLIISLLVITVWVYFWLFVWFARGL